MNDQICSIAVVGSGLTAMSMALSLARSQGSLADSVSWISEPFEDKAGSSFGAERIIALAAHSVSLLSSLGLHLDDTEATPIQQILVSDQGGLGATRLLAEDYQVSALGHVVRESVLKKKLSDELARCSHLIRIPGEVQQLTHQENRVDIHIVNRAAAVQSPLDFSAKLLVLADGSDSPMASLSGFSSDVKVYRQTALTAEVVTNLAHRNRAFERFTRFGPMALLPLCEPNRWNLIWALSMQQAEDFALAPAILLAKAQKEFGYRAGRLEWVESISTWPLRLIRRRPVAKSRTLLAGNAANTLHPVAGQGFNLALRDVATLTQLLNQNRSMDPGSPALLEAYTRLRKYDHQAMVQFTDTLPKLFNSQFPPLVAGRNLGMLLVDSVPGLKTAFARRAMGWQARVDRLPRLGSLSELAGNDHRL